MTKPPETPPQPLPPKRLLTVLAVLVLAGTLAIAVLAAWPKATVVELLLRLE